MEAVVIVTVAALVQYLFFSAHVGSARAKFGVKAPATTGDEAFERIFRVHQNTMEQLVIFIPALWLFAVYVHPLWGAGFGVLYIAGRFVYRAAYCKNPSGRSTGVMMSFLPIAIMLVWVLIDAVLSYF